MAVSETIVINSLFQQQTQAAAYSKITYWLKGKLKKEMGEKKKITQTVKFHHRLRRD